MADVFISYAREDRAQAERLAGEIRAAGLTVWWDRELLPAEEWDEAIEREITEAGAVLVIWTPHSVTNDNVKEEAHEARNLKKLVPVRFGACTPPFFFRRHQYEDLTGWNGASNAHGFQRLAIQLTALSRGPEAAKALPLDGVTLPRLTAEPLPKPLSLPSWVNNLVFLTAIGVIVGGLIGRARGFELADLVGAYWAWVLVLAASAIALFRAAELALPADKKELVARWIAGERSYTSSQAFLTMFEAVFGERHFTWRCFSRSLVATLIAYLLLLAIFIDFGRLLTQITGDGAFGVAVGGEDWELKQKLERSALLLLIVLPITNIIADYLSLWQTRKILQWSAGRLPLALGVALDFVLTLAIFVAVLPVGMMLSIWIDGGFTAAAWGEALAFAPEVWRGFWAILRDHPTGELSAVLAGEASLNTTTLLVALVTTFITSIWLWFALASVPVFWLIGWARGRRSGSTGAVLATAQSRPILALGYVSAALVAIVGLCAERADAMFQRDAAPNLTRYCADELACPLMSEIAPGPFPEGTSFHELGVKIAKPFAIGVYEVTFREWDACAADGYCVSNPRPSDEGWGRGLRPVINVSWNDITGKRGFLDWLNSNLPLEEAERAPYRLPSEAEWEYAARAGTATAYWVGDEITTNQAVFNGSGKSSGGADFFGSDRGQTLPVGAFRPNPFGLHDVHGNVREWVADCFGALEETPKTGATKTKKGCSTAVFRGGSWLTLSHWLQSSDRSRDALVIWYYDLGFRVSRTLVE